MCESGIYSISRPHTDRAGEGGMDEGREDMEKLQKKKEEREREMDGRGRDRGLLWVTADIRSLWAPRHCDCNRSL